MLTRGPASTDEPAQRAASRQMAKILDSHVTITTPGWYVILLLELI